MDSFWTGFEKRARMGLGAKAALATAAGLSAAMTGSGAFNRYKKKTTKTKRRR